MVQLEPAPYLFLKTNMEAHVCNFCGLNFNSHSLLANHIRWHHKDNTKYKQNARQAAILCNNVIYGEWIEEDVSCYSCGTITHIKYREGRKPLKSFCSRSCANKRVHTAKSKSKCGATVKKLWESGHYENTSALNYQQTPRFFSSKTERFIVKYFKENYPDDQWKSGGALKIKSFRLARDLWSDKLKICFEYDGDWHFKDIQGQLTDKRRKDRLLAKWCRENGYRLIRVDEKAFINIDQVKKLIYNRRGRVIKIGDRYHRK